jgi:hypothetical protein
MRPGRRGTRAHARWIGSSPAWDGQVLILFALAIFVLVGTVALSIDGGFVLAERRQVQSAADAAAFAAAKAALSGKPWVGSGQSYGTLNAGTGSTVAMAEVTYAGQRGSVRAFEAVVTKPVQQFFVGAIYAGSWTVSARAVAAIEPEMKPYALLVLNRPLDLRGSVTLDVNDGSVHANDRVTRAGTSNTVMIDGALTSTGSIDSLPSWQVDEGIRPTVGYTVADPLAGTPIPPKGTPITNTTLTLAGFTVSGPKWVCAAVCTLPAGYYHDSNIHPKEIQAGGTVILAPGVHFFDGTIKLTESNSTSHIIGHGVLLYFENGSRFEPGNGNLFLSAPCLPGTPLIGTCSDGAAYPGGVVGMGLWISKSNCSTFDASGNGNYTIEGVIYAPCSLVSMDGTPGANGMQVIVGELQLRGTGTFGINYRDYVKAEVPRVYLVE